MAWWMAKIYDRSMRGVERAYLGDWRRGILEGLRGEILEVGAGTGVNLEHYPQAVTRVALSEPDRHMHKRLKAKYESRDGGGRFEISEASLETLPMPDGSFDAVVSTLVLCSVPSLPAALVEIRRVLRPGGILAFLEHVGSQPESTRFKWQRRVEPVWKRLAGGCLLTRHTEAAIEEAGFSIERIEREDLEKTGPLVKASIRGWALKV